MGHRKLALHRARKKTPTRKRHSVSVRRFATISCILTIPSKGINLELFFVRSFTRHQRRSAWINLGSWRQRSCYCSSELNKQVSAGPTYLTAWRICWDEVRWGEVRWGEVRWEVWSLNECLPKVVLLQTDSKSIFTACPLLRYLGRLKSFPVWYDSVFVMLWCIFRERQNFRHILRARVGRLPQTILTVDVCVQASDVLEYHCPPCMDRRRKIISGCSQETAT